MAKPGWNFSGEGVGKASGSGMRMLRFSDSDVDRQVVAGDS